MAASRYNRAVIAQRYSAALFALASEKNVQDAVGKDLHALCQVIDAHPGICQALQNPTHTRAWRGEVLGSVLKKLKAHALTQSFVGLVARQNREDCLEAISNAYTALMMAARAEVKAEVTSATALNKEQRAALKKALEKATKAQIILQESLDPNLVGGLVVQLGSTRIDGSIRGRLAHIRQQLAHVPVAMATGNTADITT